MVLALSDAWLGSLPVRSRLKLSAAVFGLSVLASQLSPASAAAQLGEVKPVSVAYDYDPATKVNDLPGRGPNARVSFHVFKATAQIQARTPAWSFG